MHSNGDVAAGISGGANNPFVAYAEPNFVVHAILVPDDFRFDEKWGLRNLGQTVGGVVGTLGADIDAPAAWNVTTGSLDVVVGVVDTGVDYNHPDLAGNMWVDTRPGPSFGSHGFNAINGSFDPFDDNNHAYPVNTGHLGLSGFGRTRTFF